MPGVRALVVLIEDLDSIPSTTQWLRAVNNSSYRESNTLFWQEQTLKSRQTLIHIK